jgi:hypothetical protein
MIDTQARAPRLLAVAVVTLGLALLYVHRISGSTVEKDAAQVVLMGFNLERHGTMSMDEAAPFGPSNYREPAPVLVAAVGIALTDAVLGKAAAADDYFHGDRVRFLKYQNILWLALLSLGAFWAIRVLTTSFYLALLGALLVTYPFWQPHSPIDDLYTDIPAAAFFMLASAALATAFQQRKVALWVFAGLLFGIVTLIKAAELYVFAGTVGFLACLFLLQRGATPILAAARELTVLIVAFGCVVAPWMYRNHIQLGTFHISQRAGVVLMYRAVDDQMTPEEYRGTFYVYAPQRLQGIVGKLLGFSPADLQRNGRLQHLNEGESDFAAEDLAAEQAGAPEKTLSYYRRARAERVKMEAKFFAVGGPQPEIAADDALKVRAQEMILQHPWTHLSLTIPFLIRGATLAFPVLLVGLLFAARRRRHDLVVFAIPAFGTVMLYALLTHFIGRYDLPALAIATVVFLVSVELAFNPATVAGAGAPAPTS